MSALFLKDQWEVRNVSLDVARRIVQKYHYARGASNTRVYLHGLFQKGAFWDEDCLGVAWWIPPTRSAALATYPSNAEGVLSLSRLVVVPGVPKNACTFLLAQSMKKIPAQVWPCLVTYADEWQGHSGTIYRACNWQYIGMTKSYNTFTVQGVLTSRKAGNRTRTNSEMLLLGAKLNGRHRKHKFVFVRRLSRKARPPLPLQSLDRPK